MTLVIWKLITKIFTKTSKIQEFTDKKSLQYNQNIDRISAVRIKDHFKSKLVTKLEIRN